MGEVRIAAVTTAALDADSHAVAVADPAAGAVVSFVGAVRNFDHDHDVSTLDYSMHPSAPSVVAAVAAEFAARDGVIAVAVTHRVGLLAVGDLAIVAAVSAAHRQVAFSACAELVDEVKQRLPVWKHQQFTDGTDEWVNSA